MRDDGGPDDDRTDGGDVLPFPGAAQHPSHWPVESDQTPSEETDEDEEEHQEALDLDSLAEPDAFLDDDFTHEDYLTATTQEYRGLADAIEEAASQEHEMQAVAATMPGVDTGLVGFDDMTGETAEVVDEIQRPPMLSSDLLVRVGTAALLVAAFLAVLLAGGWWLVLLVAVAVLVSLGEYYATVRRAGYSPLALFGLLGGLAVVVGAWLGGPLTIAGFVVATAVAVLLWYSLLLRRRPLENATITILGVAWVAGLTSFALPIARAADYRQLLLALVLVTIVFDTGSYFAGRALGSRPLAPKLSPKKTVEGVAGGVVAAFGAAAAIGFIPWFQPLDLYGALLLAAVAVVFGLLGDLAESMVKRAMGVKDMGSVLPGHGGVLDRIDSIIFVLPAGYFLFHWLGLL